MANYPTLRRGSKGSMVIELQKLLNNKCLVSPRLKTDGEFGNKTLKAVMYFQSENWLQIDGVAGPCTWNALTGEETYNVLHPIRLVPQPTCTTCWAASTAMLLGQHRAVTVPPALESLLTADGSLLNDSELNNPVNMLQYCSYYHLKLRFPQSYTPDGLYSVLKNKPAMCNILWNSNGYVTGLGSPGHMIILAGIRGNGDAEATTLRIYDPWPPGKGEVRSEIYSQLIIRNPTFIYQLYQRD